MTQQDLADAAGVDVRTVRNIEQGKLWPRADTLAQIERFGLDWYAGYLSDVADRIDNPLPAADDQVQGEVDRVWAVLEDAERQHGPKVREQIEHRLARLRAEKGVGRSDDGDPARTDRTRRPGVRGA